jgi:hypothetical protein
MKVSEVLVKVFEPGRLQMAWQQVRKNAGAAGIDRMTVAEFAQREEQLLALIHGKLTSGSYRFQPARRVLIPKEGTSGMRKLGTTALVGGRSASGTIPQARGAFAYYGITGNGLALAHFLYEVRRMWRKRLNRRSWRGRMRWETFVCLTARYPLPPPCVVHSVYRRAATS